ncbi:50S ribosomal protein L28 [candidate division WWE3 bacterium CG09_land_8_20_14_0_10_47_33]|uniref:Large ribosomal subunit protein bL28 n=1 Tax=candidate division WWE3 bacterium CG_4_9_14_0_2_um_filter_48_10 TaxID=1975078 RepID=A0A2M8EHP8_UNCKA|nr:MAG: 50S ribosomal protein L28 [candidate division WWE3 bacterium CG09_land_8_20_14_0_10_47_33]PJC21763.1 MAG: 50S ribosomal protein L28 [candidate division WWE3 bacterium CG_4_9_14_0_2_um_filter_48_10]PJE51616.1 MAG: 50S ribosomal protein L28 [candidate division WWE3 bacterium CG10_big_fil_rev_8_21_14_0_10_48_23]
MAQICYLCHKGVLSGRWVSHSKKSGKRRFKPNLHTIQIKTNGIKKVRICSSCLKRTKKPE